jgi:catechol 2,3-dioxygenase-like lactoylglutathione lyase family enzyme
MPRLFDHIDLRVADLARSADFYRALLPALGFTLRVNIPGWLQFEASGDGPTAFFGVTEDRAHLPNANRIAFWAESIVAVDTLAAQLAPFGALNIEGPDHEAADYYAVYFEDPSGNRLEICHRLRKFTDA